MIAECPTTDHTIEVPWQEMELVAGFGRCVMQHCDECGYDHFMVVKDDDE